MNAVVNVGGINLEVLEYRDTWALSNKQVADGFGVSESTIREQKRVNEYKEGVHFYLSENLTGNAMQTFWTKKGVITLGFKLRETPQTITFRDWASDFIIKSDEIIAKADLNLERKFTEVLTALSEKSSEVDEFRQKYYASLERENTLLREKFEVKQEIKSQGELRLPRVKTGVGHKFSRIELSRAKELLYQGFSIGDIAGELNRSYNTVQRNLKKSGAL